MGHSLSVGPPEEPTGSLSDAERRQLKVTSLLGEAHAQAALALHAGEFLRRPPAEAATELRWTMFSAFLTHAGAVSRIINPASGAVNKGDRDAVVLEKVRATVVVDELPLLRNRDVRDSVEHVDSALSGGLREKRR